METTTKKRVRYLMFTFANSSETVRRKESEYLLGFNTSKLTMHLCGFYSAGDYLAIDGSREGDDEITVRRIKSVTEYFKEE